MIKRNLRIVRRQEGHPERPYLAAQWEDENGRPWSTRLPDIEPDDLFRALFVFLGGEDDV